VTEEMIATSDRVLAVITTFATDLAAAADCNAATAAIQRNGPAMKAMMADGDVAEKQWAAADEDAQKWFKTTYSPRLDAANQSVMAKVMACKGDAAFKAAFDEVNSH
jgi:hypothetical protein